MNNPGPHATGPHTRSDLSCTTRVPGCNPIRVHTLERVKFAFEHTFRHFRMRNVVDTRRSATRRSLVVPEKLDPIDRCQQTSWRTTNALRVEQVAGVVITNRGAQANGRRAQPYLVEKLADVAN